MLNLLAFVHSTDHAWGKQQFHKENKQGTLVLDIIGSELGRS